MNRDRYNEAFLNGFVKRAEASGLEKAALLPLLLGGLGTLGGGLLGANLLRSAAPFVRNAARKALIARTGSAGASTAKGLARFKPSELANSVLRAGSKYQKVVRPTADMVGFTLGSAPLGALGGAVGSALEGTETPQG